MYKKINLKQKMDLLLISIEALNLYKNISISNDTLLNYDNDIYLFLMRCSNYTRHTNYSNTLFNFNYILQTIYSLYHYIKQLYLQEIIKQILSDYSNSTNSIITSQYLKRFIYLYKKTHNYYNHHSYNKQLNLEHLAIINLYLMHKINTNYGFYFLLKYLLYI